MNVTTIFVLLILAVFGYFTYQAFKMFLIYKKLEKTNEQENTLESLEETPFADLKTTYAKSINIDTPEGKKTNLPASEFFSTFNICKTHRLNMRMLDTASGTLVGLGLLGTFLGLTLGIKGFDSSTTEDIKKSIETLMSGMGTAFMTSLVGMGLSLVYTFFDKRWRNRLAKHLFILTEKLDDAFYIDDASVNLLHQKVVFNGFYQQLKQLIDNQHQKVLSELIRSNENENSLIQQNTEILEKISYQTEGGENVTLGNAIREILKENTEQSRALKSFSTDLALELNNGFDEVMSRQMQEKLLPLMENVDTTTKAIVEHIDSMAAAVSSPATDMMEKMVDELKSSMTEVISDFNKNLSGSATDELEKLAMQLGSAGEAITAFPEMMSSITSTLQTTIEEVKNSVSEISNTSASANSTAMQQMQEQISFATGAISSALSEVKDVMSSMSKSSQVQSDDMISKLAKAGEQMGEFLNGTISNITTSLQQSMQGIADNLNKTIADIAQTSSDANSSSTKQMQEQINFATDTIKMAVNDVKKTMDTMNQTTQNNNTAITGNLMTVSEKISTLLDGTMSNISTSINESMNGIANNINETINNITKTSADANNSNIAQMQEQINFATEAMKAVVEDVKKTMTAMTETSHHNNDEITENLVSVSENISTLLKTTMVEVSESIQKSMKNVTDDVNIKQAELVNLQKETTQQTRNLLDSFNISLNKLEQMNERVKGTMDMFQKAQGEITGSTAHLQAISGNMQTATQTFRNSQKEYSDKMSTLQRDSQSSIDAISGLLENAGQLSSEYADQFTTIKLSLVSIFSQLQSGLNEYSRTVQATTQKYLDQYSSSLTETANVLSSSIQQQSEVVEILSEAINNHKR